MTAEGGSNIPDDFGYSPVMTLAHVGDPTPAPEHALFWSAWRDRVVAERPSLVERAADGLGPSQMDPSDETASHAFASFGGVRIGARLLMPSGTPRGGVVSTHGYAASDPLEARDRLFAPLVERGVAVLNIRVRGFAGSRLDTGDLQEPDSAGLGWITRGLDAEAAGPRELISWVYPQAVADLVNAARALRWHLEAVGAERDPPVMVHGESFGGGLAIAAAAMLAGRERGRTRAARVVLALPSMGDWPWRLTQPAQGAGAEVARLIAARPERAEIIRTRLRVCDSVVLASRVSAPVLCKLALRDEVVPAPSAAAVFNAIGADPGHRWRFVVPHGHAETGLKNARRHAEFERCAADFLDPSQEPGAVMADWAASGHIDPVGAGSETGSLFGGDGDGDGDGAPASDGVEGELARAYEAAGRTLDDLPYTDEFEQLYTSVAKASNLDRRGVFHRLHNMRKAGRLPRLGRGAGKATKLPPEEEARLAELVVGAVGSLGQRDRLPFTGEFDEILERFNTQTGRGLSRHDLWRLIARLAK